MSPGLQVTHVNNVYESIAKSFDSTRFSRWNCVRGFLDKLDSGSLVLDCGTGNGKYLQYRNDLTVIGTDMCENLLCIAQNKCPHNDLARMNAACGMPFRDGSFDACICVAMFHHLVHESDRVRCLNEFMRVVRKEGSILITVWALEQPINKKWVHMGTASLGDYLVPWDCGNGQTLMRYYHLFSKQEIEHLLELCKVSNYKLEYEMDNWIIQISL
jgi:ubiquinone/menaquinone biosynthesis C-methylase UbiE